MVRWGIGQVGVWSGGGWLVTEWTNDNYDDHDDDDDEEEDDNDDEYDDGDEEVAMLSVVAGR